MAKVINIPGANFQGGGGGGDSSADLIDIIQRDEQDVLATVVPNEIRDDFGDEEKGTKTNVSQALSVLQLNSGFNTGTYERTKEGSPIYGNALGVVTLRGQHIAPKNNGLSGNAWTIPGDVSGYFNTTLPVFLCKKVVSDGAITFVPLRKDVDSVARLIPSSVVYNSGPNETVVTLANPDLLTLNFGLSTSEYAEKIRLIPMGHEIQVKSDAAEAYETMSVGDLAADGAISIPGQAAFLESINFTGTVIHHDVKFSPNGTYAIARVIERTSPTDQWKFYGSSNKGVTWTLLGSKAAHTGNHNEEFTFEIGVGGRASAKQTFVSNNGKWISGYTTLSGNYEIKGVYGDLGLSNFVDTPIANTGLGTFPGTQATGNILATGANDLCWEITGDPTDLSLVSCLCEAETGDYHLINFSNGGATHYSSVTAYRTSSANDIGCAVMTGSAGSRRVWISAYQSVASTYTISYVQESENLLTARTATGSAGFTGTGNETIVDMAIHNNKLVFIDLPSGPLAAYYYIDNATTGTPAGLVGPFQLSTLNVDFYRGNPSSASINMARHSQNRMYLNTDRLVYTLDYAHADGVRRTHVHEVRDITSYQGNHLSSTTTGSNFNWRSASNTQKITQTFLATSNRLRTVALRGWQNGTIPTGHTITCTIQTLTAQSNVGAPTGTVVATALNTYDPRNLTKSTSGQEVFFNFDSPALTNGTYYALVFECATPVSATNYLTFTGGGGDPYGNGSAQVYNGTSWAAAGGDLYFRIYGDWIYDLSHETRNESQEYGKQIWNQEATLAAIDSNNLRMAHRRTLNHTDNGRAKSGHVWSSLISLGSGGVASTCTAPSQIGYQSYDKNLLLGIIPGTASSSRRDRTTGAVDVDFKAEIISGFLNNGVANYTGIAAADFVADSSFQYGAALDLDGSSEWMDFKDSQNNDVFNLNSSYPFAIEVEFKTNSVSTDQIILSKRDNSASNYGWNLQILSSNRVEMYIQNTGGTTIGWAQSVAGILSTNTYYVLRCTYNGLGDQPRLFLSTTGPNGTFTEVTYNIPNTLAFSGSTGGSSPTLRIGCQWNGSTYSQFFSGRIGYVKYAKGSSSFAYNGANYQQELVGLINVGAKVFAERKSGNGTNADMNSSYDEFGVIDPNGSSTSIVDSNDLYMVYNHAIAGEKGQHMHVKTVMNRAGATDAVTALKNLSVRFTK